MAGKGYTLTEKRNGCKKYRKGTVRDPTVGSYVSQVECAGGEVHTGPEPLMSLLCYTEEFPQIVLKPMRPLMDLNRRGHDEICGWKFQFDHYAR